MALLPRKKRFKGVPAPIVPRVPLAGSSQVGEEIKFHEVGIFLVERRMGSSRRRFLSELARRKGFWVEELMSESVTHVVSENNTGNEVLEWLEKQNGLCRNGFTATLLDITWFTESMGAGRPLEVENRHQLQVEGAVAVTEELISPYACQRRTSLMNKNRLLTEALKVLAENAEFSESEGRYLAFSRASSILKSLPHTVTKVEDLQRIPSLGVHSRKVIKEILEDGSCSEVESILHNERYQTLKQFTSIFGVGVKTADKWYREGLRTLDQLRASDIKLTRKQEAGLMHHSDLGAQVTRAEADLIKQIVERAVHIFLPHAVVTLAGGFRRGKDFGHDVDLLITHPEEGKEEGIIYQVIKWMASKDLILYHNFTGSSYKAKSMDPEIFDHFEKCLSIFRLKTELVNNLESEEVSRSDPLARNETRATGLADRTETSRQGTAAGAGERGWKAMRVDLVVAPFSQYAYALLGWTGSRNIFLQATTEEEIFAHLGLEYIPPHERNA
ncbi:DNA-directed DNA/RNA polymerase mu isoform X2 [Narcine bancroftii]|uniref:DNA-directed DNA/RNA polymerase mu isoform X2 n=1 Tax=Narcine bancroftii TaxID=1343680 RepID=UPI0038312F7F